VELASVRISRGRGTGYLCLWSLLPNTDFLAVDRLLDSAPQNEYGAHMDGAKPSDDEIADTKAAIVRERAINHALVELARIISEMDDDAPATP
jgi:hypothetical protein